MIKTLYSVDCDGRVYFSSLERCYQFIDCGRFGVSEGYLCEDLELCVWVECSPFREALR